MITLTKSDIVAIMPTAAFRCERFLPYLNRFQDEFHVGDNSLVLAHYLAQIAHESCEMRYTCEIASGEKYEFRSDLGNTRPGDGKRFKGRGLIQLTGRKNYTDYKAYCGYDVVSNPKLLEQPFGAVRSSMWAFVRLGCVRYAEADDVRAVTRRVNGGYNGLDSRMAYLKKAKRVLDI